MAGTVRVTLSLSAETVAAMVSIARRLHISRSALVSELLTEPIAELLKLVDLVPQGPITDGDVKRLRGASIDLVGQIVTEARAVASELDPHQKLL